MTTCSLTMPAIKGRKREKVLVTVVTLLPQLADVSATDNTGRVGPGKRHERASQRMREADQ